MTSSPPSASSPARNPNVGYVMGHTPGELERLAFQANLLEPSARQVLAAAGIRPGMRVLDVGTGHADVALLLAELVGPTGQVVTVDNAPAAIEAARARVEAHEVRNIEIRLTDARKLSVEAPFDLIIGRLVLLHCTDPVALLRHLASLLRPGGVLVCQEYDFRARSGAPPTTLLERVDAWTFAVAARAGIRPRIGAELPEIFRAAGLGEPQVTPYAVFEGASNQDTCRHLVYVFESMAPLAIRLGVATAEEIGLETLLERVEAEGALMRSEHVPVMMGAFARVS